MLHNFCCRLKQPNWKKPYTLKQIDVYRQFHTQNEKVILICCTWSVCGWSEKRSFFLIYFVSFVFYFFEKGHSRFMLKNIHICEFISTRQCWLCFHSHTVVPICSWCNISMLAAFFSLILILFDFFFCFRLPFLKYFLKCFFTKRKLWGCKRYLNICTYETFYLYMDCRYVWCLFTIARAILRVFFFLTLLMV